MPGASGNDTDEARRPYTGRAASENCRSVDTVAPSAISATAAVVRPAMRGAAAYTRPPKSANVLVRDAVLLEAVAQGATADPQ